MSATRLIMLFHLLVVFFLLGTTGVYMLVSLVNRLRIRRVQISWHRPWQSHSFVLALLYLVLQSVLAVYLWSVHSALYPWVTGAYVISGLFWLLGAYMNSETLITEYAVIPRVGQLEKAVGWRQMVDYVVRFGRKVRGRKYDHYTFFYLTSYGQRERMDLLVPISRRKPFYNLVQRKLDARFNVVLKQIYGQRQLDP